MCVWTHNLVSLRVSSCNKSDPYQITPTRHTLSTQPVWSPSVSGANRTRNYPATGYHRVGISMSISISINCVQRWRGKMGGHREERPSSATPLSWHCVTQISQGWWRSPSMNYMLLHSICGIRSRDSYHIDRCNWSRDWVRDSFSKQSPKGGEGLGEGVFR